MRPMTIKEIATAVVKHARVGLTQLRSFEESQEYAEKTITDHLPNSWIEFYKNCTAIRDQHAQELEAAKDAVSQLKADLAEAQAEIMHLMSYAGPHVPLYRPKVDRQSA